MSHRRLLRCACFLALFWLWFPRLNPQSRPSEDLRLTIQLDKAAYRRREPIPCRILLENVSEKALVVNHRFLVNTPGGPHEITFQILGPDKKSVPFATEVRASFQSDAYVTLVPEDVVGRTYDLRKDHALAQPGAYTVRAFYENQKDAPAAQKLPPAWKGTLESNRVAFTLE